MRHTAIANTAVCALPVDAGPQIHQIRLPASADREDVLTFRLADCDGERSEANLLLNRMYSRKGYGAHHSLPSAPVCVTFTASSGASVIGTLTLTVDSPEGLTVERTFPQEIARFRSAPGAKICELTKFAFDQSGQARPRLAALFHIIFIYGTMHFDCTDLFIEVNPRHRRFYEAMLNFRAVGPIRDNDSVGAPSQLMWLNVADIGRNIERHAGRRGLGVRSLYPYFFSAREAEGIYWRLVGKSLPGTLSGDLAGASADARGLPVSSRPS